MKILYNFVGYILNKYCFVKAVKHTLPETPGIKHQSLITALCKKEGMQKKRKRDDDWGVISYGNYAPKYRFHLSSKYYGVLSEDYDPSNVWARHLCKEGKAQQLHLLLTASVSTMSERIISNICHIGGYFVIMGFLLGILCYISIIIVRKNKIMGKY